MPQHTNAERKKRRVKPDLDRPALPLNVLPAAAPIPFVEDRSPAVPATPVRPRRPREEGIVPSFARGVESGVETLQGLRQGFIGAGFGAVGEEDEALRRLALSEERQTAAQINAPRIERVQDVKNLQDAAEFVAGIAGKQGVIFAPIIAGGLAGAATRTLPAVARAVSPALAAGGGAIAVGAGLETGDAFTNIVGDPESVENLGVQGASLLSIGTGVVSGSVEAVPALAIFKRVGLLKPFQRAVRSSLAKRVAQGTLSQSAIEGGTEAVQTIIQRTAAKFANENREILGEEGLDELLNATVAGAIFGGGIGGLTGTVGGRAVEPGSVEDQVDLEESLDELDAAGGRSSEIEAEIDALGEVGRDVRDARARSAESRVFDEPEAVIGELTTLSLTEGGLRDRKMVDQLLASVRELENPVSQLPGILIDAGVPLEQVDTLTAGLVERANVQEQEFLQDIADQTGQKLEDFIDTDLDDEGAGVSTGFQELFITRRHILRNKNGKLGFVPPTNPEQENALRNMLANLESDFPDITFESVGLGDAIFDELDKQIQGDKEESTRILLDVANEKLNEAGFDAGKVAELDPANPRAFLNQFKAIRKDVVDASLTGRDELRLTDSDVRGIPTQATVTPAAKGVSVQQKKPRPILRKGKPKTKSDFVVAVPGKKKTAEGTVDIVTSESVDAIALTNKMLTKLKTEGRRTTAVIADAFFNGLAALGQRGIEINTDTISSDLVVSSFGGKDVTFGEIMKTGSARIRARINSFQAEERRLKDRIVQIQRDLSRDDIDPEVKRRMKFIQRKLKRRIDKIPVEAAALRDAFNDAALNIRKLKTTLEEFQLQRLLDAEDQDHEFIAQLAVEADELANFLKEGGFNTLGVERLVGISQDMDELVTIARDERRKVREAKAPKGSREAGFAPEAENVPRDAQSVLDAWAQRVRDSESAYLLRGVGKDKPADIVKTLEEKGDEIVKALKLGEKIQVFSGDNALDKMRELGMEEDIERMKKGDLMGKVYAPKGGPRAKAPFVIVINPWITSEKFALETLAHEIGHVVMWTRLDPNSDDMKLIQVDYEAWLLEIAALGPDTSVAAIRASRGGMAYARDVLVATVGKEPVLFSQLTPNQKTYAISFEEWFADQVAKFFTDQPTPSKGLRGLQGVFKKIADSIRETYEQIIKVFGFKPAKSVSNFLNQIMNNNEEEEITVLSEEFMRILKNAGLDSDTPAVAGVMQTLAPFSKGTPYLLRKAFVQVLEPEERNTLYQFFNRVSTKRRLKKLVSDPVQAELIESNPLHAAVFGYQMWIAGKFKFQSTGQRLAEEQGIVVTPESGPAANFVAKLFLSLFDLFAAKFGFVTESQQAEQILDAIRNGFIDQRKVGQQRWSVVESVRDTLLQRIAQTSTDAFEKHLFPIFDRTFGIAQQRMLDTGIPGLQRIARGFFTVVGSEGEPEAFFEARRAKIGLFMNSYTRLTAELQKNPDLKRDVLASLRNPKQAKDPDVRRITAAIFKFNRRFRNYLTAAGIKIGDRGPQYFPWVWDPRKLQDNSDFIRNLLLDNRFAKEMNQWLKRRNDEIDGFNVNKPQGEPARPRLVLEELVDEIMAALGQSEGMVDTNLNPQVTGTTPWFAAMHQRGLGFLVEKNKLSAAERERFDGLFSDQLDLTMMTYIRQGVKRAEYARRFGGRSEKLQDFLLDARAEGATDDQMDMAHKYIDAMTGSIGEATTRRMYDMLGLSQRKGEVINPTFRTFSSIAMVVQNLAVLPLATLTSLVDPIGIMVRSQDLTATMAALRAGGREIAAEIRNLVGNDKDAQRSELRKLAEGMGTIEDHMTNEALEWEYGSTYLTPRLKTVNEFFFKAIALTQWTRVTRIMALAGGKEFIKRHVQRKNKNSERFLRQLGITDADVKFTSSGDIRILTRLEREGGQISAEELARDDRLRNALNRFVDESILRPNAAQRPIWASDPNYALIFHLKSFMYSFHDRILRRAWRESEMGNIAPLLLLSAFVPAMLFADILRDMIQFGLEGNPRKAHWGLDDHIWSATQRSGLNGIGQLLVDAKEDVQFGGFGYESFVGPTADGITDLGGLFAEDDETQWKAATRNLPGNAAWKHWFDNGFAQDRFNE